MSSSSSGTSTAVVSTVSLKGSLKVSNVVSTLTNDLVKYLKTTVYDLLKNKFNLHLFVYIGTYLKTYLKPKYLKNLDLVDLVIGILTAIFNGYTDEELEKIKSDITYLIDTGKIKRINFGKRIYRNLKKIFYSDSVLKKVLS